MQQLSSMSAKLVYICAPIVPTPVIITGLGLEDMLSIDDVENGVQKKTTDGQTVGWTKPVLITGTITLAGGSAALPSFLAVMQFDALTGSRSVGTLKVINPIAGFEDTFNNFTITSAWKGHSMSDHVEDIPLKFSAEIPNSLLSQLVNIGSTIAGLI